MDTISNTTNLPERTATAIKGYHAYRGTLAAAAMERTAQSGKHVACTPLGYRLGAPGSIPEPDPDVAPLIQEAFELAATGQYSLRQLLKVMEEKGLRSRTGKPLGVSALWNILRNPFYAGRIRFRGGLLPGAHEPLVRASVYNKVQKEI